MSLKESFQKEYKKSLFARQDDNGAIFYFGWKFEMKGLPVEERYCKVFDC